MSDGWWGVEPAVSGVLAAWGWSEERDAVRQVLPAVARHGNAVVNVPPSPPHAAPALAGVVAAVAASRGRALVLAAPALVPVIGRLIGRLAAASPVQVVSAIGPARASRRLVDGSVDVLVTSPATALGLLTRSALAIDRFTSLTLCWPEDWDAEEAITLLLADLSRDAQRLILTGDTDRSATLAERHARRALVVATPPADPSLPPPRSIRTLAAPWNDRAEAVTTLLELLDPRAATVWTADRSSQQAFEPLVSELASIELVTDADPTTELVIFADLPTSQQFAQAGAGRDVVLMASPGTERYLHRLVPAARPVRVTGLVDRLRDRDGALRAEIESLIGRDQLAAAAYAIGPLFDRYDPQAVAAACFALWRRTGAVETGTPAADAALDSGHQPTPVGGVATAKLWVGIGRRDEASVGDLVAVLVKEVGLPREAIGRIELRETFALVEVPAASAEQAAQRLGSVTIRRRKLVARVDRGAPGGGRGGSRGGPRSSSGPGSPRR
jgi:ATP-dependent RNA helicase DeaD